MHKNPFWMAFLSLMGIITVTYSGITVYALWNYLRLDQETMPQKVEWSIHSIDDDKFFPFAQYQFEVQEKTYQGETQ